MYRACEWKDQTLKRLELYIFQKSLLFWVIFWLFSQDHLTTCSLRIPQENPLNLICISPIFTNAACKSTCLYNAPSLHIDSQGAPKGRQQKGETGPGTHIFADFCRFSLIFSSLCKSRDLEADFRRKPQIYADFCRNRFLPFAVSLLARS